jgi:hypothetical protein
LTRVPDHRWKRELPRRTILPGLATIEIALTLARDEVLECASPAPRNKKNFIGEN